MIWRKLAIWLLSSVLAFGVGWGVGYKIHKVQQLQEENGLLQAQRQALREGLVATAQVAESLSIRLDELQAASSTYARKLRDAISRPDPIFVHQCSPAPGGSPEREPELAQAQPEQAPGPAAPDDFLLRDDLACLLNASRLGEIDPSASCGEHAQGKTPPAPVSAARLIEADLEVVEQYHELAARHNALIDALEKQKSCEVVIQ